jgi:Ca2+-binding RTX toxin-like protein
LSYSIAGGADAAKFTIDASSGTLAFIAAPNFEAPTDSGANNVYDVTVQVSDGNGGTDTQAIAVTVRDVSEISGNSQPNTLTGTNETDIINGLGGNDTLIGLGGADALDGGTGTDTASYAASPAGVTVSLATGRGSGGDAQGDTLVNIENLTGSAFGDTLEGDGGNNVLLGGAGIDTISYEHAASGMTVSLAITSAQKTVGAGTDTISGFENLIGSAFNDSLTGSSGANTLTGGAGADQFFYKALADSAPNSSDIITDFLHGVDKIDLSAIDANTSLPQTKANK